jgi:hypothetical protein
VQCHLGALSFANQLHPGLLTRSSNCEVAISPVTTHDTIARNDADESLHVDFNY